MLELIDYKWALAGIAALISFCNLIYYISNVIKGKTKPHMYTWLVWGLVTVVASLAQIMSGGGAGAYYTMLIAINCLIIATLAYFKGEKDIHISDKYCLFFCFIAIIIWPLFKTPLLSVLIVTAVDTVGFMPTVRKSYLKPHEENLFSFAIYALTYSLSILALDTYNFITIFYPAVIVITAGALAIMLIVRRKQLGHKVFA